MAELSHVQGRGRKHCTGFDIAPQYYYSSKLQNVWVQEALKEEEKKSTKKNSRKSTLSYGTSCSTHHTCSSARVISCTKVSSPGSGFDTIDDDLPDEV